jgi:hypothetical protein
MPKQVLPLPMLGIVQGNARGACEGDDRDKTRQDGEMNRVKPNDPMPEEDLNRNAVWTC